MLLHCAPVLLHHVRSRVSWIMPAADRNSTKHDGEAREMTETPMASPIPTELLAAVACRCARPSAGVSLAADGSLQLAFVGVHRVGCTPMCHTPTKSKRLRRPESESGALHNFSSRALADVSGAGISAVA